MKINEKIPPRLFQAGAVTLQDCGSIELAPDQMVSFVNNGREFDVTRKEWGFYATPSLNGRLKSFGWRSCLTRNPLGRYFVLLVEEDKQEVFLTYARQEQMEIVQWLDAL